MKRRIPIIPTIIVLGAILTMIALGIWQLQRADWKAGLIERYHVALATTAQVPFPHGKKQIERSLYRRSTIECSRILQRGAISGRSANNEQGWAWTADCATPDGPVEVLVGWSIKPGETAWQGGSVSGIIAPAGEGVRLIAGPQYIQIGDGFRQIASHAGPGLAALAKPDPSELPNNHIAYAWQWFFFAATALVIYILALRTRWRDKG